MPKLRFFHPIFILAKDIPYIACYFSAKQNWYDKNDMFLTQINKNATRFYRLELLRGLFGDWALVQEWGRIGFPAQTRTDWFDCEAEAKNARFDLHMKKAKSGYD